MQLLEGYFEELFDPKDILQGWRKKSWDRFQEIGWPKSRQEAFQYVHLKDLFFPKPAQSYTNDLKNWDFIKEALQKFFPKQTVIPREKDADEMLSSTIFFVDGYFQKASLPSPIICLPLDQAMRTYGIFLQNRLTRTLKEETDPFATLNGALQGKGAFLYIPPNCHVQEPIELIQHLSSETASSPRLHIYLNKGSCLTLIQTTLGDTRSFCNGFIDVTLDEGAEFHFQETQNLKPSSSYFQTFRASLKRNSRLKTFSFCRGADLARSSMKIQLLEENSEAELLGLSDLNGSLENHTHILVEHLAPHCRSHQHFKTVLKDKSRSSFEGKIFVRPTAQKTESYQLNNNLLLSDESTAYSKPNLEIFADDVKASHGATITQLDPEELFYLTSRGLSVLEAEKWLIQGFMDILLKKAHPSLVKRL